MKKFRLLIPLTIHLGVRYLLRTGLLSKLAEHVQPVVLLSWEDDDLWRELELAGIEVHRLPQPFFGTAHQRVRRQLDLLHQKRLRSPSTSIRERRIEKGISLSKLFVKRLRRAYHLTQLALPGQEARLLSEERRLLDHDTNLAVFVQLFDDLKADAVFSITPFTRDEELLLRAAELHSVPMVTSILSFDNITIRGWIPAKFGRYMVWNHHNVAQLRRAYPHVPSDQVRAVGPAQFDFYWDKSYLWNEDCWRQKLSLPADRPVILYGGGPSQILPHEPHLIMQIDDAVAAGEIPGAPIILFRRHPMDPVERWRSTMQSTKHVYYDDPWSTGENIKYGNITPDDIAKLVSTLYHSAVHVNVASTMAVDGAIFDRPQVGPAYDDRSGRPYDRIMRELYHTEHYLPITHSGGLHIVYSRNEMVKAITAALKDPTARSVGRKELVREVCAFVDGQSAERVYKELIDFLIGERKEIEELTPALSEL
jgi:hypothetical protein